jgi:hypothetical protein
MKERRKRSERSDGTRWCARCQKWLSKDVFKVYVNARYAAGIRVSSYCDVCRPLHVKEWQRANKDKVRAQHGAWRQRSLAAGGDTALRWYFTRKLSSYRMKSREMGLVCDLDADYLLELFHRQHGLCYYTCVPMLWDNYGKGKGLLQPDTMTVDRLTPTTGYIQGNVVLCTHKTNTSKSDRSEEDFYAFCEQVLKTRAGRQHPEANRHSVSSQTVCAFRGASSSPG